LPEVVARWQVNKVVELFRLSGEVSSCNTSITLLAPSVPVEGADMGIVYSLGNIATKKLLLSPKNLVRAYVYTLYK